MNQKPERTMEFQAAVEWRERKFGEIFVGKERHSRGLFNPPPVFGGLGGTFNAEDMIVSALSFCQMSTFLHFVEANGIQLVSYQNSVVGTMTKGRDGWVFTHFKIDIDVMVKEGSREKAEEAIGLAKRFCIVGNSLKGEDEIEYRIKEEKD